jgi:mannan endo-1,4-beta-mannosidase
MQKQSMIMTLGMTLLIAVQAVAGDVKLPEPQSGMIVVPKGVERSIHPGQAFLGGQVKGGNTDVRFSWNGDGLVAIFDCTDADIVAVQGRARDNAASWKDDSVELLLDPGHKHGVPTLIRVTAAGALWDAMGVDTSYNVKGLKSRVVRTSTGWRARMEIPWQGLGVAEPKDGEVWGMNTRRLDHAGSYSLKTMTSGSWMPAHTDNQDALGSGHIAFILPESAEDDTKLAAMRKTLYDGQDAAVRSWAGPNDGDVITLDGDKPATVQLARIGSGAQARQATQVKVSRNETGLVVDFDCEDADITAALEGRDNPKLWKDDSVYVWLDPAHDHKGMIMVQVSAKGMVNDTKGRDSKWNLEGLVAETKRTKTGWAAHIVLPWKSLGIPSPPMTREAYLTGAASMTGEAKMTREAHLVGFNLSRMDQPGEYDYALMQMSAMTIIPGGDLGKMHRWGHLAFGKAGDPAKAKSHIALKKAVDEQLAAKAAAEKAEFKRLTAMRGIPANLNASDDVKKIVKWLTLLPERKENRFFPANDIWCYDTIDGKTGMDAGYIRFAESIHKQSGKWLPMIHVSFGDPSNPQQKPFVAEQAVKHGIAYWKAGGLVHIHVNPSSPLSGETYQGPNALAGRARIAEVLQPGTEANKRWMATLDAYAKCLTELRDAGVVAFWRPLHEMGFNACYWYDWGATKSGDHYIKLWRHMFKYFSEEKKLDNLVWVWGGGGSHSLEMYPGPEYVDMVGFSHYGSETTRNHNEYEHMLKYNKPVSFTEFGPAGKEEPAYDNMNLIRAVREQYPQMISATYWHSWTGVRTAIADCRNVKALMNHPWVITRDELDWKSVKLDK